MWMWMWGDGGGGGFEGRDGVGVWIRKSMGRVCTGRGVVSISNSWW